MFCHLHTEESVNSVSKYSFLFFLGCLCIICFENNMSQVLGHFGEREIELVLSEILDLKIKREGCRKEAYLITGVNVT